MRFIIKTRISKNRGKRYIAAENEVNSAKKSADMDIGGEGAAGTSVNTDKEYLRNGSLVYVWGTVSFSVFKFSFCTNAPATG